MPSCYSVIAETYSPTWFFYIFRADREPNNEHQHQTKDEDKSKGPCTAPNYSNG